ncbi:MAG TPA: PEP-utilizing enzyme, partial [Candidatus Krumholzibacterium sp.]|nr:PEP-utilizing enzyme [Candidatus Krumholzibacterium sp.]
GQAEKLVAVARKSYRLRDDDNIYLDRVEAGLRAAVKVACDRIGERCSRPDTWTDPLEVVKALREPGYVPKAAPVELGEDLRDVLNARQMRGQPAGKGIARGIARVIRSSGDLFSVEKDEILVCDSIDPTMTFVVPLVSGIVERRGGMLIHGAIIAREYGIACVTGVPGATEFIRTGDQLTVDGYRGIVIDHSRTSTEM